MTTTLTYPTFCAPDDTASIWMYQTDGQSVVFLTLRHVLTHYPKILRHIVLLLSSSQRIVCLNGMFQARQCLNYESCKILHGNLLPIF